MRNIVRDLRPFITAILLYISLGPYFVWGLMKNDLFMAGLNAAIALLFFINSDIKKESKFFVLIIFVLVIYSLTSGVSLLGFIYLGFSVFAAFGNEDHSKKTFTYFANIYSIIILVSSIVWIGVLLGYISPIGTIDPTNELKPYDYSVYPLTVSANYVYFFRFHGPFDEPGVVGTFNAILLFILGFKKNDWKTYALLLSGALTLSLFFFIEVVLFFAIKNFVRIRLTHIMIFAAVIGVFYETTKDNEIISNRIWERLEWNKESGKLEGDNRMHEEGEKIYKQKQWTIDYWFGDRELEKDLQYFEGSSSYKVTVLKCGMICFALYILFFLLYAHKYCRGSKMLLFTVLLITTLFQRPWMFGLGYFFLFPFYARFNIENNNDKVVKNLKVSI